MRVTVYPKTCTTFGGAIDFRAVDKIEYTDRGDFTIRLVGCDGRYRRVLVINAEEVTAILLEAEKVSEGDA